MSLQSPKRKSMMPITAEPVRTGGAVGLGTSDTETAAFNNDNDK